MFVSYIPHICVHISGVCACTIGNACMCHDQSVCHMGVCIIYRDIRDHRTYSVLYYSVHWSLLVHKTLASHVRVQ